MPWCEIDLTLQSPEWLNYQIVSDETMLAAEVEDVRDKVNNLLRLMSEGYLYG